MNSRDLRDRSQRVADAAEMALLDAGWAPRKFLLLADVIDVDGMQKMLGTGSDGLTPQEVLVLLARALSVTVEGI